MSSQELALEELSVWMKHLKAVAMILRGGEPYDCAKVLNFASESQQLALHSVSW